MGMFATALILAVATAQGAQTGPMVDGAEKVRLGWLSTRPDEWHGSKVIVCGKARQTDAGRYLSNDGTEAILIADVLKPISKENGFDCYTGRWKRVDGRTPAEAGPYVRRSAHGANIDFILSDK